MIRKVSVRAKEARIQPLPMKVVLFVCEGNTARSQMAEGLFNAAAPPGWSARSAGLRPKPQAHPDPEAILVMKEFRIDISRQSPKAIHEAWDSDVSLVVALCSGCPEDPKVESLSWPLPAPRPGDIGHYKEIRDALLKRIKVFVSQLTADAG